MDKTYYETIDRMEKASADRDYINGWACGYLQNPKRESQRVTPAYDAGYEDGAAGNTDHMNDWTGK